MYFIEPLQQLYSTFNSYTKKINIFKLLYKHCINSNYRFAPFIADAIRDPLREQIENCKALSIMYDGATDTSVSEVEIIYVRLLQDGYPKDYFMGLVDLEHAHADGVFTAIDTAMNNHGSIHWKEKVVGGGSDGASVNIGKNKCCN
jgi:hypothetical protein